MLDLLVCDGGPALKVFELCLNDSWTHAAFWVCLAEFKPWDEGTVWRGGDGGECIYAFSMAGHAQQLLTLTSLRTPRAAHGVALSNPRQTRKVHDKKPFTVK